MLVGIVIGLQHLGHAFDVGRGGGDIGAVVAEHEHVDRGGAHLLGAGDRARGGLVEFAVEVVGDDQNLVAHSRPFSLSLLTSSSTDSTLMPPPRSGGATVLTVSSIAARSTPRSSRLVSSIGFFFAFMMSGSLR